MRIEVRPTLDEPSDHGIDFSEVALRAPKVCPPPTNL
jgi:hypothetical protein